MLSVSNLSLQLEKEYFDEVNITFSPEIVMALLEPMVQESLLF